MCPYRILSGLSQGTLGEDDNLLEKLFDIILDFKLIPEDDPERYMTDYRLWHALDGLLCRTLPANTVTESVKTVGVAASPRPLGHIPLTCRYDECTPMLNC